MLSKRLKLLFHYFTRGELVLWYASVMLIIFWQLLILQI